MVASVSSCPRRVCPSSVPARHRLRDRMLRIPFAGALTLRVSVFRREVGTACRQRTQIEIFLVILVDLGSEVRRGLRPAGEISLPGRSRPRGID